MSRSADLCFSSWQTLASIDLKAAFNKLPVSTNVNLVFLAKNMHGYSGANLTEICQRVTKLAIWKSINSDIWKQQERKAKEEAADDDTNMEENIKRNFLFLQFVNNSWTWYCGDWLIVLCITYYRECLEEAVDMSYWDIRWYEMFLLLNILPLLRLRSALYMQPADSNTLIILNVLSLEFDKLKLSPHISAGSWKNFYFDTSLNILLYTYITDLADLLCVIL